MRFANWTDAEIQRWCLLRAIEWCAFPAFASQPLVPILLLLFPWYWVIAAVVVLNTLWRWSGIGYSYVNITAAKMACLSGLAKWPFAIGSAIYLIIHRQFVPGLIALSWPLLVLLIPSSGKFGIIELAFAKKLGYVSEDAECQAAARYRKAAEQGNADAQYLLGLAYALGDDVPQDYTQAAAWYRKAAEQGVARAQFKLGLSYKDGRGVPQDDIQAAAWFRKAAEQGDAEAQFSLGDLYAIGLGVRQDATQAAAWYRKAAEQGDAAQAALRYRKEAEQGDAWAQYNLGVLYYKGHGVTQEFAEAYFWSDLAAAGKLNALDIERVAKLRDESASHLTPADLARVQERARKWFEAHQAKPQ